MVEMHTAMPSATPHPTNIFHLHHITPCVPPTGPVCRPSPATEGQLVPERLPQTPSTTPDMSVICNPPRQPVFTLSPPFLILLSDHMFDRFFIYVYVHTQNIYDSWLNYSTHFSKRASNRPKESNK